VYLTGIVAAGKMDTYNIKINNNLI